MTGPPTGVDLPARQQRRGAVPQVVVGAPHFGRQRPNSESISRSDTQVKQSPWKRYHAGCITAAAGGLGGVTFTMNPTVVWYVVLMAWPGLIKACTECDGYRYHTARSS